MTECRASLMHTEHKEQHTSEDGVFPAAVGTGTAGSYSNGKETTWHRDTGLVFQDSSSSQRQTNILVLILTRTGGIVVLLM